MNYQVRQPFEGAGAAKARGKAVPKAAGCNAGEAPAEPDGRRLRFSIVIANYNYAKFIRSAIESALALDWPHVDVVVVDDGSTDGSVDIIRSFEGRVVASFQANAGQRVANNVGFALAQGDVIVFLDADDVLEPGFAREVAAVWNRRISKVQVQMIRVDAQDRSLGSLLPQIDRVPDPAEIRAWASATTEYPTPPGSGNAYARDFLAKVFPIGPDHDSSTDSTCLALAPLLGDVVTVLKPLARYRQHGANDSNLFAEPGRFGREVGRAMARQRSVEATLLRLALPLPSSAALRRNRHLLQLRVASLRLQPERHPLPDDGRIAALWDAVRCLFGPGIDPLRKRLIVAAWSALTLAAPRPLAKRLISLRFTKGGQNPVA
ncbi:MAG: glycosyltransferase family 2 protein [Alphaproteobacteria bacterium]|nr:glycosyltransferase family 2 protein [Alphaproteobacteria bacterium]